MIITLSKIKKKIKSKINPKKKKKINIIYPNIFIVNEHF